ncbi:hypothetical protein AMTRI_Chr08g207660 [Amborella trichopoda]|uniref:Uncharacterized protein n=1 Tax=Amborella trichopoda TaxID=13333 RepID=W1NJ80_AMBTC|nr:protein EARLY RESPONSIVE TO DEHYDRATION 15 [Amborella trichopoda]ERM95578.1 hypothetical protein AMTR_s00023p00099970 [Amborella trichopoda]|eukprot:XP_006828162.1 protein EARLY RESPONSIVE TO DEHYDRATION 15 [Amborella trichopoda]
MDVISRPPSSLNPNAPLFVPWAFRLVEDFSDEWWALVQSSPWFRDYWLRERQDDFIAEDDFMAQDNFSACEEELDLLPEIDSVFDGHKGVEEGKGMKNEGMKELATMASLKYERSQNTGESKRKITEKAPKIVNMKLSPRPIQQPR